MAKKLDLTGQRFGKLTVLRPAENIGDCTAWICQCDCGQETVVRTSKLRSGRTASCGCRRLTALLEMLEERKNNTSSVPGVEWLPHEQQWKATIRCNGNCYHLGVYPEFENAVRVRKQAEKARMCAEEKFYEDFLRELK